MKRLESQRKRTQPANREIAPYEEIKSDRMYSRGVGHFLNSIEVTHSNYTQERRDSVMMGNSENEEVQRCIACGKWEQWAKKAENSMLNIEKDLIQKEQKLRRVITDLKSQLAAERSKKVDLANRSVLAIPETFKENKRRLTMNSNEIFISCFPKQTLNSKDELFKASHNVHYNTNQQYMFYGNQRISQQNYLELNRNLNQNHSASKQIMEQFMSPQKQKIVQQSIIITPRSQLPSKTVSIEIQKSSSERVSCSRESYEEKQKQNMIVLEFSEKYDHEDLQRTNQSQRMPQFKKSYSTERRNYLKVNDNLSIKEERGESDCESAHQQQRISSQMSHYRFEGSDIQDNASFDVVNSVIRRNQIYSAADSHNIHSLGYVSIPNLSKIAFSPSISQPSKIQPRSAKLFKQNHDEKIFDSEDQPKVASSASSSNKNMLSLSNQSHSSSKKNHKSESSCYQRTFSECNHKDSRIQNHQYNYSQKNYTQTRQLQNKNCGSQSSKEQSSSSQMSRNNKERTLLKHNSNLSSQSEDGEKNLQNLSSRKNIQSGNSGFRQNLEFIQIAEQKESVKNKSSWSKKTGNYVQYEASIPTLKFYESQSQKGKKDSQSFNQSKISSQYQNEQMNQKKLSSKEQKKDQKKNQCNFSGKEQNNYQQFFKKESTKENQVEKITVNASVQTIVFNDQEQKHLMMTKTKNVDEHYDSKSTLKFNEEKTNKKRLSKSFLPLEEQKFYQLCQPEKTEKVIENGRMKKSSLKYECPSQCQTYLQKSRTHQTLTDCSYILADEINGNFEIRVNREQPQQKQRKKNKESNNPEKPTNMKEPKNGGADEAVLQSLKFENQNLKAYNRVLLEKLSNSRPRKY